MYTITFKKLIIILTLRDVCPEVSENKYRLQWTMRLIVNPWKCVVPEMWCDSIVFKFLHNMLCDGNVIIMMLEVK